MTLRNGSMRVGSALLLGSFLLMVNPGEAHAAELHVAPAGAPYTTIQSAIDAASAGDRILIAEGTYNTLNSKTAPDGYTGPAMVYQIVFIDKSLNISGGYDATFSHCDPELYPTIIDGFNQTRCIFVSNSDPVIEGLRIRNGNATGQEGSAWADVGGGIYAFRGSPIFLDSLVTNCRAEAGGGAFLAYCDYFNLIRVDFVSNRVTDIGGGFETLGSDGYIDGCLVLGNISDRIGGGGYISYSSPDMVGCEFRNNSAGDLAGGLGLYDTWATIGNCTFTNNSSDDGGGIWC